MTTTTLDVLNALFRSALDDLAGNALATDKKRLRRFISKVRLFPVGNHDCQHYTMSQQLDRSVEFEFINFGHIIVKNGTVNCRPAEELNGWKRSLWHDLTIQEGLDGLRETIYEVLLERLTVWYKNQPHSYYVNRQYLRGPTKQQRQSWGV